MADRIQIQIEEMEALQSRLAGLSSELDEIRSRIRSVDLKRISGSEVKVRLSASSLKSVGCRLDDGDTVDCLSSIAGAVSKMGRYTDAVAGSIGMAADAFAATEKRLAWQFGGVMQGESSMFQSICRIAGFDPDHGKWTPEERKKFNDLISSGKLIIEGGMGMLIHNGVNYLLDSGGLLASYEEKSSLTGMKQTSKIYPGNSMLQTEFKAGFDTMGAKTKFNVKKQKEDEDPTLYFDKDGNPTEGKEEKELGQELDILSVGVSGGVSSSILYSEGKIEGDRGSAEGSIGVGNAEFIGSIQGGFGTYLPGEDGEMELYAGIDAQIGVSVSALNLEGSAEYELIDGVEVSAEGDISVLKGMAEATASIGIIGGEFVMHAKAGAEANLVEVNGEVGVDIGGVKGSVGAGVQVGIGASAEAGYKDGVISLDASLSIGVGVSINVELDVSGLVDGIGNAMESVGNAMESFADGLCSICAWWG